MKRGARSISGTSSWLAVMVLLLWSAVLPLEAQEGLFMEDWQPRMASFPAYHDTDPPAKAPSVIVRIDLEDTVRKISPYFSGYNQPVHAKGAFHRESEAVRHVRNVQPQVLRYPGGTAAMSFFWDRDGSQGPPEDVDTYIKVEQVYSSFRYGMEGGDFFSLDSYYKLIDSVEFLSPIIVINYGYARYGRSENPVAQAAHYAAEWVRYDAGRTRFWEIGNEVSGRWTPGHFIDTTKNRDGQLEEVSGTLYAQHFRVFADSMRAAAAEINTEIRIGGVLSHNASSWNREFLENASDVADFLIIHEYYGRESVTDPAYAVTSADGLTSHKDAADADILAYAEESLPVVLTEWNTKDALQSDRCIYGMSGMRAVKNIITAGYGLSCRHTLIQRNARGLINNEEAYSGDLGVWQPRASFFYYYYMRQFLGDTYFASEVTGNKKVDALASGFHSGEAGVVLFNYSDRQEVVALDMDLFEAGNRYYWYTLTPDGMDPFSPRVRVNGNTNTYYPEGGPFQYEDLPARSRSTEGLVKVPMPPFSAVYLLVDAGGAPSQPVYTVTHEVYGRRADSVFQLPDAFVALNSSSGFSSSEGIFVHEVNEGPAPLYLQKDGFDALKKEVIIKGDTLVRDTLETGRYDLALQLKDSKTGEPVTDVTVQLGEATARPGEEGSLFFEDMPGGASVLHIDGRRYTYETSVFLYCDTTLTILLEEKTFALEVLVRDSINHVPLYGIEVSMGGLWKTTDLEGRVTFILTAGSYQLVCSGEGYLLENRQVDISQDTLLTVRLTATSGDIKFVVYEEGTPLNDVRVTLEVAEQVTNALGICTFRGLKVDHSYGYSMQREGYRETMDTLWLQADTTVQVQMIPVGGTEVSRPVGAEVRPNPAGAFLTVALSQPMEAIRVYNVYGRCVKVVPGMGATRLDIRLEGLAAGIYGLIIVGEDGHQYPVKLLHYEP